MTDRYDEAFEQLAAAYFDGTLDASRHAKLKAMLREDDTKLRRLAELAQFNQMIESELTYRRQTERFGLTQRLAGSGDEVEAGSTLDFAAWRESQRQDEAHRQRQGRVKAAAIAIAAVVAVLVSVSAIVAISNRGTPLIPPVTQSDPASPATADTSADPLPPPATQAVATITATHNAVWSSPQTEDASALVSPLTKGSPLRAGDRLTLTAGFAEITTQRGAIAILEAPATIELTHNDNALRLHTGKLVGICETDSSKGFVVRTEYADITDIGTVFGVVVDAFKNATAEVIVGEIEVSHARPEQSSERLFAGQSASIDPLGYQVTKRVAAGNTFTPLVALHDGITDLSGQIELIQRGQNTSRTKAKLIHELAGHRLASDITVSADWPADAPRFDDTQAARVIPAGTTIRSYTIYFAPNAPGDQPMVNCRGRVTFSGRVLGLVTTDAQAQQLAQVLADEATALYPDAKPLRWPEYGTDAANGRDRIDLIDDGRTLVVEFNAHHIDAVRVIVEEPPNPGPTE
ncbi:MAG: hypothetical protein ACPGYV_10155 [Phycisphaeraceae bacterium]